MTSGKDTIGMIGVGLMGHGIASNILKHGYPLVLLDHSGNQPVDGLLAAGAAKVASAAQVERQANVIILCVPGKPQVEKVLLRHDCVMEGLRARPEECRVGKEGVRKGRFLGGGENIKK